MLIKCAPRAIIIFKLNKRNLLLPLEIYSNRRAKPVIKLDTKPELKCKAKTFSKESQTVKAEKSKPHENSSCIIVIIVESNLRESSIENSIFKIKTTQHTYLLVAPRNASSSRLRLIKWVQAGGQLLNWSGQCK